MTGVGAGVPCREEWKRLDSLAPVSADRPLGQARERTAAVEADVHTPTRPATTEAGRTGRAARDPFFDNAKYLAIVLVAAAHAWEPFLSDSRAATALYLVVYTFHIPAFVVVSGYFSRGFDLSPPKARRLVTGLVVPYLVFQTALTAFRRYAGDSDAPYNIVDPYFVMWFLVALFLWRLTTPVWETLRRPLPVALAVGVGASVTPDIGDSLDLQRVLQFLPFFVLGLRLEPAHFARVRRRAVRLTAVAVLPAAAVAAYWAVPRFEDGYAWFFRRDSVQELGVSALSGAALTLLLLGVSLVMTVCFLAWVPGRRTWFTALGAGTLYGYLLHGFVVKGALYRDLYDADWVGSLLGMVTVTVAVSVVVTLLCTSPVRRVLGPLVEPRLDWLFRPRG